VAGHLRRRGHCDRQNIRFFNVIENVTYNNHCALKGGLEVCSEVCVSARAIHVMWQVEIILYNL
jgi:hypothetical protein